MTVVRRLLTGGFLNILTATRCELDLRRQSAVDAWFAARHPRFVIHAAGTVGGTHANMARPAEFMYDYLLILATVLRAAWQTNVTKLLYLGSSWVYRDDLGNGRAANENSCTSKTRPTPAYFFWNGTMRR